MIGERTIAMTIGRGSESALASAIDAGRKEAGKILGRGSKSFALAGLLLGKQARDDAAVLYAWCRQADDRVDDAGPGELGQALRGLERQLDDLYAGRVRGPIDIALHELVSRRGIRREYFQALLDGFAMDAAGASYATFPQLDLYAFRVAGVVGLMMCHVLGVRDERCLRAAAHLGMAMQLTNIARDVVEDFGRGRQYLPSELLPPEVLRIAMLSDAGHPSRRTVTHAVKVVLRRADVYYRSGLSGLRDLGWRSAVAIGAAARIYRAIGGIVRRRGYDPLRGRAVVSLPRKLLSVGCAFAVEVLRVGAPSRLQIPTKLVRFDDVQA